MAKILVVDDDRVVRTMVADMLVRDKHEVLAAADGTQAWKILAESPVDLIVTDLVMPEKNGIDLIMDLKINHPKVPIVAISGGGGITGRFDYLPIAKLLGAKSILRKPFHMKELITAVSEALTAESGGSAVK